jgi:outer membrane protein W
LLFPTKLSGELRPYLGKGFNMDMVKENETLRRLLRITNFEKRGI